MEPDSAFPVALSIAGSDSGGNAGIQADLLSFAANGAFGTTAITCLTAQNPDGVSRIETMDAAFVGEQIAQVTRYYEVSSVKTGMLFSSAIIEAVSRQLSVLKNQSASKSKAPLLVVDPVMVASSGDPLLEDEAVASYKENLLPLADLITPNLDEAKVLLGRSLTSLEEIKNGARELSEMFATSVLIKGGHLPGNQLFDVLAETGSALTVFEQERISNIDTHGSGCTLSAACAAHLALGKSIRDSVKAARSYLRRGMENPLRSPKGNFINHGV